MAAILLRRSLLPLLGCYLACLAVYHTTYARGDLKPLLSAAVGMYTARSTIFWLIWGAALWLARPNLPALAQVIGPIWALLTIVGYSPTYNLGCGAAFMVCLLPLQRSPWMAALVMIPMTLQSGATPYLCLGAMLLALALIRGSWPALGFCLAPVAWAIVNPSQLHEPLRWRYYRMTWDFLWQNVNPWLGAGLGSYVIYGPIIGKINDVGGAVWLSVHNDYLQVLFEVGIIGAVLIAVTIGYALVKLDDRHRLSLVGLLAFGAFYFPMAIPVTLVFGFALVLEAFQTAPAQQPAA